MPITLESLWQIGFAEVNRRRSRARTRNIREKVDETDLEKKHVSSRMDEGVMEAPVRSPVLAEANVKVLAGVR